MYDDDVPHDDDDADDGLCCVDSVQFSKRYLS